MLFEAKTAEAIASFTLSDHQQVFLRDVDVFLDYLVKNPVPVSKNKNQPPVKWAEPLNRLLSSPDVLTLKRPLTASYARIMGLLLLGRSSGLASLRPDSRGNTILHVHDSIYQQWQVMTDIERYFTLLEAWINRGYATNVGERISAIDNRFLSGFMMMLGDNDLWQGRPAHDPGFYLRRGKAFNLSILKMTGLADFQFEDSNRKINYLKLTPWGQLFLTACRQGFKDSLICGNYEDDDEQINLLPAIKTIRSDVNNTLEKTAPVIAASYILSVALGSKCTRTLKVSADHLLEELAEAILEAFDFDNDHLYHFQYLTSFGADRSIGHPAMDFCDGSVTETRLHQLQPFPGMKITFVFDYGVNWEFEIVVMHGSEESTSDIQVIERKGKAPEPY
ncbi:plasmid pRiA4b ORF-3 family protein [Endozoicomonas sp. SCSIO W0465]|uniref:plasmid pRiA4b ORF-3 family protein n=1 Tax=Endozoicomonas sp. SCSIO W0465 TaxID=2918516 RepID=UPI0020763C7B|nr:plasmid pRiA4b ORF-3 family protein [Endozoicomonas sp. SCSIO W0465]USE35849.1 plasmid pRiA4b ORF-3 family protein [Endozoicomonas sp. SCSIO W0465]